MYNEVKIRFNEPKYTVNETQGTVTCELRYYPVFPEFVIAVLGECLSYHPFTVTAIAKVCSEDTFNEKTGKRVALAKAEAKAYKQVGKYCFKKCGQLGKAYNKLYDFYAKAQLVVDHNYEYINKF